MLNTKILVYLMHWSKSSQRVVRRATSVSALLISTVIVGCAGGPDIHTVEEVADATVNAPQRTITGFTQSLACMDMLLAQVQARDITLLVEAMSDQTKKVNIGGRDMLISALSEMSVRSRALKVITFGDTAVTSAWQSIAGRTGGIQTLMPNYVIRGSISQFDDSLVQQNENIGANFGPLSAGKANTHSVNLVAVDMALIDAYTTAIVPGVVSKNSLAFMRSGKGLDGDGRGEVWQQRFGISYNFSVSRSEGQGQAVRNLLELGLIELIGRSMALPYWKCLGVEDAHPAVQQEIRAWYESKARNDELIGFFQYHLASRGVYSGPVDGRDNVDLRNVLSSYRASLGLPMNGTLIDFGLFSALVTGKWSPRLSKWAFILDKPDQPVVNMRGSKALPRKMILPRDEKSLKKK